MLTAASVECDEEAGDQLHYGWWDALIRLRKRAYPNLTFGDVEDALWRGELFIREWAQEAENIGCQPIHILKPPSDVGKKDGGLAWRWTDVMEPIGFLDRTILAAAWGDGLVFAYGLERDGSVRTLLGEERRGALKIAGIQQV